MSLVKSFEQVEMGQAILRQCEFRCSCRVIEKSYRGTSGDAPSLGITEEEAMGRDMGGIREKWETVGTRGESKGR